MNFKEILKNKKDIFKNKKVFIPLISLSLVIVTMIGILVFCNYKKPKTVDTEHILTKAEEMELLEKINPEELKELVSEEESIEVAKITEKEISMNVSGVKSTNEIEALVRKTINTEAYKSKNPVGLNFFDKKEDIKKVDDFYVKGLIAIVTIDSKNNTAKIESFKNVNDVKLSDKINDYKNESVKTTNNGTVLINLDLSLDNSNSEDIVSQSKAYIKMFKSLNDVKNVQLDVNHGGTKNIYSFNDNFNNVLKEIKTISLK